MDPVSALALAIADEPDVHLAVLFGSGAPGVLLPDSDLDLGVKGPMSSDRLSALAVALSRRAGRQVDLASLDDAPPLLRFEIARSGMVLLERGPHLFVDFKARAFVDWWEWAPYARRFASAAAARLKATNDRGAA